MLDCSSTINTGFTEWYYFILGTLQMFVGYLRALPWYITLNLRVKVTPKSTPFASCVSYAIVPINSLSGCQ